MRVSLLVDAAVEAGKLDDLGRHPHDEERQLLLLWGAIQDISLFPCRCLCHIIIIL